MTGPEASDHVPVFRRLVQVYVTAALLAVADLGLKSWTSARLPDAPVFDFGFLKLRPAYDAQSNADAVEFPERILLTGMGLAVIILGAYTLHAAMAGHTSDLIASALILGGATAELVGRVEGHGHIEYFYTGWLPDFNLAEVWLIAGMCLLGLAALSRRPKPPLRSRGRA
ncbi:signal peptidase II [Arthrobacter sp. VKM Ac-2550]|nr:signal peptidase II [Arthrobacter sp. VKM Ac-2550]